MNARATIKRTVLFVSYESFLFCTAKLWKEDEKALNEAWKLSVKGEGIIENRVHKNSLQFLLTVLKFAIYFISMIYVLNGRKVML